MLKTQQKIDIVGPVGTLETIVIPAKQDTVRGIAVIAHPNPLQGGTNTNKVVQTCARALSELGYTCFCPNLRGVGHSEGEHDHGRGEVEDMLAVVAYAQQHYPAQPLVLAGFSFGGFVASHVRLRIEAERLILLGPAVSRYEMQVATVPENTLIIHGEEDEVIPLADILDWARPQNLPVVVFPGAGHFFHGKLIQLAALIRRNFGG